ncbi:MAG: sugar transferase [Alphaproteobacteria bacterium]|nr:MAG: sugar transferase [Alphaproteobacteria bacterium]
MKRSLDLVLSLTALAILLPVFIPIMVVLRFTGEGEVFYLQERIGLGRKPFKIIKFATMLKDSPNLEGGDITVDKDPRILPFGNFLRKTKINELPQIFNVLFGSMSIVGPRPLTPRVFDLFGEDYKEVLDTVKPGITGLGSVAFRNEEELLSGANDHVQMYREKIVPRKTALERYYRDHVGAWTDIKVILLTVIVVLLPSRDLSYTFFPDLPKP